MEGLCRSDSHPLASLASVGVLLFQIVLHKLENILYEVSFAVDGDCLPGCGIVGEGHRQRDSRRQSQLVADEVKVTMGLAFALLSRLDSCHCIPRPGAARDPTTQGLPGVVEVPFWHWVAQH